MTTEEIQRRFNVGSRQARDMLAMVGEYYPVISTSDKKGHYIATKPEHIEDVEHTLKEFDSRQAKIESRKSPLYKFRDKVKFSTNQETQNERHSI